MTNPSMRQAYLTATQLLSMSRNPCVDSVNFELLITFIKLLTNFVSCLAIIIVNKNSGFYTIYNSFSTRI
jgi:hypothetical protein